MFTIIKKIVSRIKQIVFEFLANRWTRSMAKISATAFPLGGVLLGDRQRSVVVSFAATGSAISVVSSVADTIDRHYQNQHQQNLFKAYTQYLASAMQRTFALSRAIKEADISEITVANYPDFITRRAMQSITVIPSNFSFSENNALSKFFLEQDYLKNIIELVLIEQKNIKDKKSIKKLLLSCIKTKSLPHSKLYHWLNSTVQITSGLYVLITNIFNIFNVDINGNTDKSSSTWNMLLATFPVVTFQLIIDQCYSYIKEQEVSQHNLIIRLTEHVINKMKHEAEQITANLSNFSQLLRDIEKRKGEASTNIPSLEEQARYCKEIMQNEVNFFSQQKITQNLSFGPDLAFEIKKCKDTLEQELANASEFANTDGKLTVIEHCRSYLEKNDSLMQNQELYKEENAKLQILDTVLENQRRNFATLSQVGFFASYRFDTPVINEAESPRQLEL